MKPIALTLAFFLTAPLDHAAISKKRDEEGDDDLSFEEYRAGLAKQAAAEQRFKNFDTNHAGVLSEEGFVRADNPVPKL